MTVLDLKEYEIQEFVKAFEVGTKEAWEKYNKNVMKKVKAFEKETGLDVDVDALMA